MGKLNKIKLMLQSMLAQFSQISTDKGLIYWQSEGELPEVGESIMAIDEEGNESVAESGEYRIDTGDIIVIEDGKVTEVRLLEEQPQEEPKEEPVDEVPEEKEEPAEEPVEEPKEEPEEEPAEEPQEEPAEEVDEKDARIAELEARVAELEAENAELRARIAELEEKSAAEPASEVFEKVNKIEKTGNSKLDKLTRVLNSKL